MVVNPAVTKRSHILEQVLCSSLVTSELRCYEWIGRFPVQTPLGTRLSLGTQPCYEASDDLRERQSALINFR